MRFLIYPWDNDCIVYEVTGNQMVAINTLPVHEKFGCFWKASTWMKTQASLPEPVSIGENEICDIITNAIATGDIDEDKEYVFVFSFSVMVYVSGDNYNLVRRSE